MGAGIPATLAILLICAALSFLPGFGLLTHVRCLRPAERLACSGPLSAALCGSAALALFLLARGGILLSPWLAVVAPLLLGSGALALAILRGLDPRPDADARQVGHFWLLLLGELALLELLLPTFGGADWFADWWVHFHRSLVYGNLVGLHDLARTCVEPRLRCVAPVYDNGVLTARTPLYNLLGGIAVGIAGGRLAAYQLAAAAWGAVLAGPVVLLAQRRGRRMARTAGLLLLLNPFLVHLALYPWPKVLTGAFEVLAIYWLCRLRDGVPWAAGAMIAALLLAVFTHTAAVLYLAALGGYLVLRPPPALRWQPLLAGTLVVGALILPWVVWGTREYGWRGVFLSSPTTSVSQPSGAAWLGRKADGLVFSLLPMPLVHALERRPFDGTIQTWTTVNFALEFPFNAYTGGLGAACSLLVVLGRRRLRLSSDARLLAVLVAGSAALGSVALDPTYLTGGAATNSMAGTIALGLVALAWVDWAPGWRRAALTAVGLEAALVAALYSGYLSVGTWYQDPNTRVLGGMGQRMLSAELGTGGVAAVVVLVALAIATGLALLVWISHVPAPSRAARPEVPAA